MGSRMMSSAQCRDLDRSLNLKNQNDVVSEKDPKKKKKRRAYAYDASSVALDALVTASEASSPYHRNSLNLGADFRFLGLRRASRSFYVGDAAGRSNDHSDADLKFAEANGLKFYVPEDFFEA
ncbi:hypothetical protein ABKV19_004027 [Rosa sericea]